MKRNIGCPRGNVMAILRLMKLITLFVIAGLMQVHAEALSQTITLSGNNLTLENVLESVEKQTDYVVFGSKVLLKKARPVTVSVTNMPLESFLKRIFNDQPIGFELGDKNIIISKKTGVSSVSTGVSSKQETINFRGKVVDKNNKPLASANIRLKNSKEHTVSDNNGFFSLTNIERNAVISISLIGFGKIDIPVSQFVDIAVGASVTYQATKISKTGKNDYSFHLQAETISIDEVVITGIVERKKESFTGATASFTGDQLLKVGNTNILQSLKTLDPSFIMVDNTQFGSDPNRLANIEVRGRSSFTSEELKNTFGTNPNLPLFILDGFESDLRTITDLNIHRIARITLLKDAASTALYGSRAANGVVVVETKQPKPGKIEISYSTDLTVNAAFLNDYNLMNAAEKLEFERLSGQFNRGGGPLEGIMIAEADYYNRLADVKSGVDTYWLSEPLRTGFSNGHNINLSGGSNELRFNAGVSYKTDQGVMKGSGRDTWRGSLGLTYRKDKLNITNQLIVNGFDAKESPYGEFSDFSQAIPYYKKTDALGNPQRYLNIFADPKFGLGLANDSIPNPLYVAKIGNRNTSKSFGFTNNLQANYDFTSSIRLTGAFSITISNLDNVVFRPSENPEFDNKVVEQKGLYRNRSTESSAYQGSLMLTYAKVFNEIHQLTANLRAEVQQNKLDAVGFEAMGFATLSNGNPNLASGYTPYGRPSGQVMLSRRNNLLASVNYALKSKYLFDFSYRYDGSTAFGSAKRYSPFWSTGIGWNIHNENAVATLNTFNLLKLRGSIGYTGNQQFGEILSANVYQQLAGQNRFGEMADLISLGNPNLAWQRTQNLSLGLDFGLLDNRLNGYVNIYRNSSSPLIVPIAQAPSAGVVNYYENVGMLTYKGIELQSVYSVIYRPANRFIWNVSLTMAHNKGEYSGFEGRLNKLNQAQRDANSYTRYLDGNSPEDIWAVRSAGIDPLTGKELFIKKDGSLTFQYDAADETVLGNTRPKIEGVIGTNLNYKGFSTGVYLRYSYKGDVMNTALYNKVENLSGTDIRMKNLDKRALYDRWKKDGDISAFKAINDNSFTPISSRFIQSESFISGESLTMGYRFTEMKWLKKAGLQDLNIAAFTNNIFRSSTIKNERGIEYPFASSVSININATF
jgi:TonB-linked SusC/RagA family outer membrane protein